MANKRRLQFDLAALVAAPLLLAPAFLGLKVGAEYARGVDISGSWLHLLAVTIVYVVAFCWLATRYFDRRSNFRKFPFRGSMLIGACLGPCFTIQFASGALAASVYHDPALVINAANVIAIAGKALVLTVQSIAAGVFFGGWLGILAGSGYCIARWLRESITGKSTIRPGQARNRIGIE